MSGIDSRDYDRIEWDPSVQATAHRQAADASSYIDYGNRSTVLHRPLNVPGGGFDYTDWLAAKGSGFHVDPGDVAEFFTNVDGAPKAAVTIERTPVRIRGKVWTDGRQPCIGVTILEMNGCHDFLLDLDGFACGGINLGNAMASTVGIRALNCGGLVRNVDGSVDWMRSAYAIEGGGYGIGDDHWGVNNLTFSLLQCEASHELAVRLRGTTCTIHAGHTERLVNPQADVPGWDIRLDRSVVNNFGVNVWTEQDPAWRGRCVLRGTRTTWTGFNADPGVTVDCEPAEADRCVGKLLTFVSPNVTDWGEKIGDGTVLVVGGPGPAWAEVIRVES